MSKLIYVDRLKKDILALPDCHNGFSDTFDKACIIGVIDEQPTIEKRKTGRWLISYGACEPDYMECSRCKWITEYYGGLEEEWGYCPNCGADMRGEEHERGI